MGNRASLGDDTVRRYAIILAVAFLLILPLFFLPMQTRGSWPMDVNWMEQFATQFREGHLYPRWLPESNNGSGAPVFYFYAPLPFFVGLVPSLLGATPYAATLLTFGIGLAFMGVAMLHWLEGTKRPLLGAILFMTLPYTLIDFVWRAAIGEFFAIGFIPLIALALRDRRVVLLAFSYFGMVIAHLPLALLVSLFLIVPYGLFLIARDRDLRRVPAYALGLTAGLAMAALYFVPAMTLQEHINIIEMSRDDHFDPETWLLFENPMANREFAPVIYGLCALLTAQLVLLWREHRLLAGYGLAIMVVVTLGYGLWSIPLLAKVQFPWRALPLAGFAVATAMATDIDRFRLGVVLAIQAVGAGAAIVSPERDPLPMSAWLDRHIEVAEYLPPTAPDDLGHRIPLWAARQEGIFYFPSLGTSSDGLFLDGEPELRMLDEEKIGLAISLFGLALALGLVLGRRRVRWLAPSPQPRPFALVTS